MYLQEILEVAVGLVFMWLIISLSAMQFQEWIANLLKWRSKDLEKAIRKLLANGAEGKQFYAHPLIRSLSKPSGAIRRAYEDWVNSMRAKRNKPAIDYDHKPAYIPAGEFALTCFDIIIQAGTEASPVQAAFKQFHQVVDAVDTVGKDEAENAFDALLEFAREVATSEIGEDAIDLVKNRIGEFAKKYKATDSDVEILTISLERYYRSLLAEQDSIANTQDETLKRIRLGLVAIGMTNPKLQSSLRSLLTGVEGYITEKEQALMVARKNVETWFDDSMARLSGWYKRKAQLVAFLIGLVLAILLNVDSISVATLLWREPTLRQQLVAQAEAYAQTNPSLPAGEEGQVPPPTKTVAALQADLEDLRIPFGWETEAVFLETGQTCQIIPVSENAVWGMWSGDVCKQVTNAPADSTGWWGKVIGIFITAAAAAQGAPFWFDILKKLINVRSSGPNPVEQKPKG
ncbi:MAG: hypothetical protein HY781_08900 [Chloroflexi bacterium]|nr:hypothetical protein [Chloroflexota bacterium]